MAGEKVTAVGDRMLSEWLEKTQFEEPQPLKWGNAIKSWPSQLKRKRKPGSASNETTRLDHESQVDDSGTPLFNNRTVVDTPNNYGPYQDFTGANHNEGWRSVQSAGNLIEHTIPLQLQQASSAEITEATPKSGVSCLDTTPEITKSSQLQSDPKPRLGQDLSIGAFQGSADLTIRPPIMDNGTQYQQRSDVEWEGLPWPFAPESSMFENIPVTTELNMDSWNTYTAELTFWGTPIIEKSNHVGLP